MYWRRKNVLCVYNKNENENNFKPELSIINDEKLKGSTTSDLTEIIKNEQGQQMKLEKIVKKGAGNSKNLVTDIPNKNYIFYNLKTVDDKKDIIIANDEEYKIFIPEQNKESQWFNLNKNSWKWEICI